MTVIGVSSNFSPRVDCWFQSFLNAALSALSAGEAAAARHWIEKYVFDAALDDSMKKMNVTEAVRRFIPHHPDWQGTALQPLYDKTGKNDTEAAKIYGNLVCRVGISRPEVWWSYPEAVAEDRFSRTYILRSQLQAII